MFLIYAVLFVVTITAFALLAMGVSQLTGLGPRDADAVVVVAIAAIFAMIWAWKDAA